MDPEQMEQLTSLRGAIERAHELAGDYALDGSAHKDMLLFAREAHTVLGSLIRASWALERKFLAPTQGEVGVQEASGVFA